MNYHKIKTTRQLASGEIKTYEYMVKYNYTPKGTKLKEIKHFELSKNEFVNIIN